MDKFEDIQNRNYTIVLVVNIFIIILYILLFYIIISNNVFSKQKNYSQIFLIMLILVLMSGVLSMILSYYLTKFTTTITIKDKMTPMYGKESIYRIVDSNNNIFEIKDNLLTWDFNSANDYVSIKVGKTYKVSGYGARIQILSQFPKLNTFEEV